MVPFRTHLTELEAVAASNPSSPAFIVPQKAANGDIDSWKSITYQQFISDVELASKYWSKMLRQDVPLKSTVGLWLSGLDYSDVIHIYGISRAGYVPQLFSLRLPNPTVVFELLARADAKALIFDQSFESIIPNSSLPRHVAGSVQDLAVFKSEPLPPFPIPQSGDELVFVYHTSGSTSGSPKLVPCNHVWVNSMVHKSGQVCTPKTSDRQDVSTWMGSMCHIAQSFMLIGAIQHGSCTIQPTRIDFSSDELTDMIRRCNLNRLNQFPTFLGIHIRNARQNPKLLALMRRLDQALYSGLPLPREDEEFAYRNGITLINLFGSTEGGAILKSQGGQDHASRLLRSLDGVNYDFIPIAPASKTESGHVSVNNQLKELVILSSSPDCPHYSLRRPSDGHFHTGDLFLEVTPGGYLFRGRDDDWIKSRNSLRCDTRSIEDNLRAVCGELVENCIVVGTGRPSPALFVEPATDMDHNKLKEEIVRRTRHFHSRRYLHERITSVDLIFVVGRKTLPRTATKGNIRRQAVEELYKQHLDDAYGVDNL